jgi:hypothetical protein
MKIRVVRSKPMKKKKVIILTGFISPEAETMEVKSLVVTFSTVTLMAFSLWLRRLRKMM